MNELIVIGKQNFMGKALPIVLGGFGKDKKCMCDKTIAEIHNQPVYEIRKTIGKNINRFYENIDFIDFINVSNEITNNLLEQLEYTKMQISKAEHIYLLSERGYAKLIKIMDSDLAWEIHDRLIDEYFQLREEKNNQYELQLFQGMAQVMTQAIAPILDNQIKMLQMIIDEQKAFFNGFNQSHDLPTQVITEQDTSLTNEATPTIPTKTQANEKSTITTTLPDLPDPSEYKKKVYKMCHSIISNSNFKTVKSVLSHVYNTITKKYGIVWSQLKKDFEYEHGYLNNSIIDIIANSKDSTYVKSITLSILNDLDERYKKEKLSASPTEESNTVGNWDEAEKLTTILAKMLNDNSPHNVVTYSKIYKLMESNNNINWDYYVRRYKKDNNITARKMKPTKKQMIEDKLRLQKMFIKELSNLMATCNCCVG